MKEQRRSLLVLRECLNVSVASFCVPMKRYREFYDVSRVWETSLRRGFLFSEYYLVPYYLVPNAPATAKDSPVLIVHGKCCMLSQEARYVK